MTQAKANWVAMPPWETLARYVLAIFGPLAVSLVHFAASLLLLRTLMPHDFGVFSFIMVAIQFGFGLSNALAGTPFTVRRNQEDFVPDEELLFFRASLVLSLGAAVFCAMTSSFMSAAEVALPVAAFAFLTVARWFFRSYFYAVHKPFRAVLSDMAYAVTLLAGLGLAWMERELSLTTVFMAFAAAAFAALACGGPACLKKQIRSIVPGRFGDYRTIWREQSCWTLLGVVSTEATANAHAWLVTFFAGPAAFSPLAAAALFFRPVALFATSLTQLERPVMTRALAAEDKSRAFRAVKHLRLAMLAAWGGTAALAFAVLFWRPLLVIKDAYDLDVILLAAGLWAAITLLHAWRAPDSTLLQAANYFRPLAGASVWSGIATLCGVMVLLPLLDPVFSLLGVLAGQGILAWRIALILRTQGMK